MEISEVGAVQLRSDELRPSESEAALFYRVRNRPAGLVDRQVSLQIAQVITRQQIAVPQVELALVNHRMGPGGA